MSNNKGSKTYRCSFSGSATPNPGEMLCNWVIDGKRNSLDAGRGTNNEAELRSLIYLLKVIEKLALRGDEVVITSASEVVIHWVLGKCKCHKENLRPFIQHATRLMRHLTAAGVVVDLYRMPHKRTTMPKVQPTTTEATRTKAPTIEMSGPSASKNKDFIKRLGGRWDHKRRVWQVPESSYQFLSRLVAGEAA